MRRVVVTGIGAVGPLGNSLDECWKSAKVGRSGLGRITRFDASALKWKMAGEVKGFEASGYLSRKDIIRLDPFAHYAVAAALMAAADARLTSDPDINFYRNTADENGSNAKRSAYLSSAGVIIGSSRGGICTIEKALEKKFNCSGASSHRISAFLMPSTTVSMASSYVARKLGIKGYCLGLSNACASGSNAIGEGYRMIKTGYSDLMLCGGAEAPLCRICIEGYGSSGTLSKVSDSSASRPFDRSRDGFVLSEGACILVLENLESALKRGVRIYGEVAGYGNTNDAYHQIMPSAEGEMRAMRMAMEEAGVKPADIDFVSAHGTSTQLGDKTETQAIKMCFGKRAYSVPVSSVKSMTGHMLSASGAFEVALTMLCMREAIISPTINLKERDPECDLDYVTKPRRADIEFSVSNSFGFGGVNAVLVLRRPDF
ncbi:MAG: beta-ketoacyl-ACP synthase II [Nitrospirota bacterium]